MTSVRIILSGDGAFPELEDARSLEGKLDAITALSGGMHSGSTSIGMLVLLPDGTPVFVQTSLVLFVAAARAFVARYGDPAEPSVKPGASETSVN